MKAILTEVGVDFEPYCKNNYIFKGYGQSFAQVNEVYGSYFTSQFPARETVAVAGLPKNVNVEISVTALKS